jgi:ubiquinol-cytochrome c reductase cytochrome c1 subunit
MLRATALLLALGGLAWAAAPAGMAAEDGAQAAAGAPAPVDWESWRAGNSPKDLASLQRGARNFINYCNGCHALKYERFQRLADDLKIPASVLEQELLPPGRGPLDYIDTTLPPQDAVSWFGKVPPDLSLMTRFKGPDYVFRFLKTFYVDPGSPSGSDNLAYPGVAMPAVLSDLGGVDEAVFRQVGDAKVFDHFVTRVPGSLSGPEFDQFVRDTVNFLDYVGEPTRLERQWMGLWVVLFLVLLTMLTRLLKIEYWKDVR